MIPSRPWSRPLVPLTAALAAGIAAPSFIAVLPPFYLLFLIPGLILLLAVLIWQRWPVNWCALLLFFCLGQAFYGQAVNPRLAADHLRFLPQHSAMSIMGRVQSQPVVKGADLALDMAALAWSSGSNWQEASGLVRLYGVPATADLKAGDENVVRLRLQPVTAGNTPESRNRMLALARQQIFVTGRLWPQLPPVKLATAKATSGPTTWRQAIRQSWYRFLEAQPQPARALFLALLLGDQSQITPEVRAAFQRTGTSHLLAISGLHLGMIAAAAFFLVFWLLRRWTWLLLRLNAIKTAFFLAAWPMLTYAWLAGGSPATQRAALMILAGLVMLLLDRPKDFLSLLAFAAFIILIISPLQLYSLSFQLSFLSVWGVGILAPVLFQNWQNLLSWREDRPYWLRRAVAVLIRGLATTLAATLATLPVIMAAFHQVPTYGLLANLFAVPLVGFLILPLIFLAGLVSGLLPPLALILLTPARWALAVCLAVLNWAAALPGVVVRLPTPTPVQILAYIALLSGLFSVNKRGWRWLWVGGGVLVLSGSLIWSTVQNWNWDSFQITALAECRDLSLVARFPGGRVMVLNAGRPRQVTHPAPIEQGLRRFLLAKQWRRLDYLTPLTITAQNTQTLKDLIENFEVQEFWYNGERPPLASFWELRNSLGEQRRLVRNVSLQAVAQDIGGVRVTSRQLSDSSFQRPSGPVMLQFEYRGQRLLILPPGTALWRERCLNAGLSESDVLILPAANLHHDFMSACLGQVKPHFLIITGLPSAKNLSVLEDFWAGPIYLTSQSEITVTIDMEGVQIGQQ